MPVRAEESSAEVTQETVEAVTALLRRALWGEPLPELPDADWEAALAEMRKQSVLSLVNETVLELPLDAKRQNRWSKRVDAAIVRNMNVFNAEMVAVSALTAAGVGMAVLKGSAAAMYYPNPIMRTRGDVDVLINPADEERACTVLADSGWELVDKCSAEDRHAVLVRQGVVLELHRCFFAEMLEDARENPGDILLQGILPYCVTRADGGLMMPAFPDDINALVMLEHMGRHISQGIGLRYVVDWGMFVHAVCDDEYWRDVLCPLVTAFGLAPLARALARVCRDCLGFPLAVTWCDADDGTWATVDAELFAYVMRQGTFGHKRLDSDSQVEYALSLKLTPLQWLRKLQEVGVREWPRANTSRAARSVAWVRQAGVYANRVVRSGAVGRMSAHRDDAQKRRALLKQLGFKPRPHFSPHS